MKQVPTIEEYTAQLKEIDEQIKALKAERVYVEKQCAADHAEFKVGDRIITKYSSTLTDAMVTGHKLEFWRELKIIPLSVKVKKDGTLSTVRCVDSELSSSAITLKERGYGQRMGFIKEETPTTNQ